MYPAADMEGITLLCMTSMTVQGLQMVRLGAEVLLQGSSGFRQPDGKLGVAVAVAGAGIKRWQGCHAVDCCTFVAAGGVLWRELACRELCGCLLRAPSLHCKDPAWVMMHRVNHPSQQEALLTPQASHAAVHMASSYLGRCISVELICIFNKFCRHKNVRILSWSKHCLY